MELLSVSKEAIQARVARYFHDVFRTPTSALKRDTNVRRAYSYRDAAWSQLANVFNKLSWMRQLGVLLSPHEMPGLKTIGDITDAIWRKLNKLVAVTPLATSFTAAGVRQFAAPKKSSPRKKAKARPKTRAKARPKTRSKAKARDKRKSKQNRG